MLSSWRIVGDPARWPADARQLKLVGNELVSGQERFDVSQIGLQFIADKARWMANDQRDSGSHNDNTSPRFLLEHNGNIVASGVADNGWKARIVPAVDRLFG